MIEKSKAAEESPAPEVDVDALIVGAGFAGLLALYKLRQAGFTVLALEASESIGGVWNWNRYPGARCDVESMQYSYSFSEELQQTWEWSERYATQPEILRYIEHVADRFDLNRHIQLNTRVVSATYQAHENAWQIQTNEGQEIRARFCIMATGCLSAARMPEFPGKEKFKGDILHTGHWPKSGYDFTGKNVAVIGTGSSGIQAIPMIAKTANSLTVLQRTATYSVPARNRMLDETEKRAWKENYAQLRETARYAPSGTLYEFGERKAEETPLQDQTDEFEKRWAKGGPGFLRAFSDISSSQIANKAAGDFIRAKIADIVKDPEKRSLLTPATTLPVGSKRICVDTGYFETFNRENVDLIDIRNDPIKGIEENGLSTKKRKLDLDCIVFATGFDVIVGSLMKIDIKGLAGRTLREKWKNGPGTYLGLMVAGFPNLFLVTGPGSPSVLTNMMVSIEQHIEWITACVESMRRQGNDYIDPDEAAESKWMDDANSLAETMPFLRANSWYMASPESGSSPRRFMLYSGGVGKYREICEQVAQQNYPGFNIGARHVVCDVPAELS
ncbi:flavin-containing monooxygenase [Ottowia thiooxydans]|uniref:flavin-containing monooxygenase n=1 Tax=Ottowia thiooxydans TaxID=219182 RepID=UPI0006847449|nr:NAD(P)/FAD-dependent oxidoreductase [Ottowia thiooxydans]